MPRAFLIAHKRFNPEDSHQERETSPESHVNTAESTSASESCLPSQDIGRNYFPKDEAPLALTTDKRRGEQTNERNTEVIIRRNGKKERLERLTSQALKLNENCADEFYNLTKLAEVSLAAAAGQLFLRNNYESERDYEEKWQVQEYPEDLSRDMFSSKSLDQKPPEIHICPECGKRYSTSSNLARHRQTHRSLADKKARTCPHCDKIYVSMPAFSMHVRTHNQGCKCSYCGKCFSRPWLLQGHIRTHTGEKPFKCTICAKAFADKSNLRAHIQTHSSMKPHVCGRCGKAFALKSYLYKHEESSCMKTQTTHEKKSNPVKGFIPGRVRTDDKPILSIPTPVISIAIRV